MKKEILFFFTLIYYTCSINATIYEIKEMRSILDVVEEGSWIFFDIDGTLIESEVSLNSTQWISYFWETAPHLGFETSVLEDFIEGITKKVPIKLLEPEVPQLIAELKQKHKVIALTARAFKDKALTETQLASVDVNLDILFTSGQLKGSFLAQKYPLLPVKAAFVDDKLKQLMSLEDSLSALGIACDCFWYRKAEEAHPLFSPELALVQLHYLMHYDLLLSDEGAKEIPIVGLFLINLIKQYEGVSCTK